MNIQNAKNHHAAALTMFDRTPKTVYAAIAASFAMRIIESTDSETVECAVLCEWQALYDNGIVPQRPPRKR